MFPYKTVSLINKEFFTTTTCLNQPETGAQEQFWRNWEARKLISYKVLSTQSRDPIFCNTKITAAAQLGHKIAWQKVFHFGKKKRKKWFPKNYLPFMLYYNVNMQDLILRCLKSEFTWMAFITREILIPWIVQIVGYTSFVIPDTKL